MITVVVYCQGCGGERERRHVSGELARAVGADPDGTAVQSFPGLCPACYAAEEHATAAGG